MLNSHNNIRYLSAVDEDVRHAAGDDVQHQVDGGNGPDAAGGEGEGGS